MTNIRYVLGEESPDAEFDHKLHAALQEGLKSGDVPGVILPLGPPAFLSREDLIGNGQANVLRPYLKYCCFKQE